MVTETFPHPSESLVNVRMRELVSIASRYSEGIMGVNHSTRGPRGVPPAPAIGLLSLVTLLCRNC